MRMGRVDGRRHHLVPASLCVSLSVCPCVCPCVCVPTQALGVGSWMFWCASCPVSSVPISKHRFKNLRFKQVIVRFKGHRRARSKKAAGQAVLPGDRQQVLPPPSTLCFLDVTPEAHFTSVRKRAHIVFH